MDQQTIRKLDAFDRVIDFGVEHPLTPPLASVTALMASMGNVVSALYEQAGIQDIGSGEYHGGSNTRQLLAEQLRELMRPVAAIARTLDPVEFPGVRQLFKMPNTSCYAVLIARAEAFVTAMEPIKDEFVDRGLPETIDTTITSKKTELIAATDRKHLGKATRMSGTANLKAKAREGMLILRELDAILSYQYREDPGLLAAWKGACRVFRAPSHKKETAPPPPPEEAPAGA